MHKSTSIILFFLLISLNIIGQPNPFGNGQITNQNIGPLDDNSVVVRSESGYGFFNFFPDAQQLLRDYNFDIYVPDDYDGSEAYGLVTFINSGNNGGFKTPWLSVLDDKKMIWIAGDNIGNKISIDIRMGVAMAAALRVQELYNIDTNRIFTSGNSGGARMAHNLAFIYPETFKGAMPSCGGSYIRQVDQDYETQDPNSHYEFILSYPSNYLDYLLPFDQRFANMTSFNDFREGDVMNIYHNGSEVDGIKGKLLETSGNHCSTTTEHFLDAVNFVEHPFSEVINEEFEGPNQSSFKTVNATLSDNSDIELTHNTFDFAQIQSKDLFSWNDPMGVILETSIQLDPNDFNMNSSFNLGIWSMDDPNNYCGFIGTQLSEEIPAILLSLDFINSQPTISVKVKNPTQPDMEVLFSSTFTDWKIDEPLSIKYHLWDKELRIELGAHLSTSSTVVTGVKLLDDLRSIRFRWNEIANNFWTNEKWIDGAFITLSSVKKEASISASNLYVSRVKLIAANLNIATQIPNTSSTIEDSICQGETYEFNNTNLTESGTYNMTLSNAHGCDSLINLNLIVHPLPKVNLVEKDSKIMANAGFKTYQWYFDKTILNGETDSTITPTESGDYYVEVTDKNDCVNASNTINYIITATEINISSDVVVHTSLSSGELIIHTNALELKAELFDIQGKLIMTNLGASNDISNLANGIYVLVIQSGAKTFVNKIHKRN